MATAIRQPPVPVPLYAGMSENMSSDKQPNKNNALVPERGPRLDSSDNGCNGKKRASRSSTPRVKTGCKTCRIRRIKCDEGKPACLRCSQTGRKCDGYFELPGPPSTSPTRKQQPAALPKLLTTSTYSIPFRVLGSQRERQLLHYYCSQGARDISGFFPTEFWSRTVLQAAQNNSAIRQGLIAWSSLNLAQDNDRHEALDHYGRALRGLQKMINNSQPQQADSTRRTVLVCTVIFCAFEHTLGNTKAAMKHLHNGLHIMKTHDMARIQRASMAGDDMKEQIAMALGRMDVQASLFDDGRLPSLPLVSDQERESGVFDSHLGNGTSFRLEDAHYDLIKLQNWLFHVLLNNSQHFETPAQGMPQAVLKEKDRLLHQFHAWRQKVDKMMASDDAATPGFFSGIRVLLVQHQLSQMVLASRLPENSLVFTGSPNPNVDNILAWSDEALKSHQKRMAVEGTGHGTGFSSEAGLVMPLFLLAIKCGTESVCHRVIELLVQLRREGPYNAETMAITLLQLERVKQERQLRENGVVIKTEENNSIQFWAQDILDQRTEGADTILELIDQVRKIGL